MIKIKNTSDIYILCTNDVLEIDIQIYFIRRYIMTAEMLMNEKCNHAKKVILIKLRKVSTDWKNGIVVLFYKKSRLFLKLE